MLKVEYTSKFARDLRKLKKRGKSKSKIKNVIYLLITMQPIPEKYRNHKLSGNYENHWELYLEPDWLFIYIKTKTKLILIRTGSHTDLF